MNHQLRRFSPLCDRMIYAARQLTQALNNPSPPVPYEHVGDEETTALTKLAEIFNKRANNRDTAQILHKQKGVTPSQRVPKQTKQIIAPTASFFW